MFDRAASRSECAGPDGLTALHFAAQADDAAMLRLLLEAGANPNAADRYGTTPLHLAATNGSAAIDRGADKSRSESERGADGRRNGADDGFAHRRRCRREGPAVAW